MLRSYLGLSIRPSGGDDADGEQHDSHELYARVSLPPDAPCNHGCNTSSRSENDVDRDRNIIAESMVVQGVDAEEQHNVDQPAPQRHLVRSKEERRSRLVELRDVARDGNEEKLDESQESATGWLDPI